MIKIYHLSKDIKDVENDFYNFREIPEDVQKVILQGNHFRINGIELLIYHDRQLICSCTIQEYKDNQYIMDCWTNKGNLFNFKNIYE